MIFFTQDIHVDTCPHGTQAPSTGDSQQTTHTVDSAVAGWCPTDSATDVGTSSIILLVLIGGADGAGEETAAGAEYLSAVGKTKGLSL